MLDLAGYTLDMPLESMVIVEPSVGEGSFLAPILERLLERALGRGIPLESLSECVRAFDLDHSKVEASRRLTTDALVLAGADSALAECLARQWVNQKDYLLSEATRPVDIVVGNPPYIRYDDLEPGQFTAYQSRWSTLAGRGDIYLGFWEKALSSLKPGGVVAYICADRWMRNNYGARLREFVGARYNVRTVWTMHDVDAFHAKVASYPAITVIANEAQGPVAVADTTATFGPRTVGALLKWSLGRGKNAAGEGYQAYRLAQWYSGKGLWPTGTPEQLATLDKLSELPTIEQSGARVGIGVASGADGVYVVQSAPVETERLLPMATRASITPTGLKWAGEHLVNPWDSRGELVDISDFPQMNAYLTAAPGVRNRHVAQKSPSRWHRTIDKVIPGLAEQEKLLIPDMRSRLEPYLDQQGLYPHHNFYWITSDVWDMKVLGGLLLSETAQSFVEAYCVRMRGGTLRLQAQYLRTIRVPNPAGLSEAIKAELAEAFQSRDRDRASAAARLAYGLA